ncbi:MAG TPA: penicillin-binding protein 1C [Saprospiraceae bacterium]|nr:penicillin-binding protein 1C [Saprospiraceae bacterium]
MNKKSIFGSPGNTNFRMRKSMLCSIAVVLAWWWFFALPDPLFQDSYSTVLLDKDGELLSARIADDQQWRFPEIDSVPEYFAEAVIAFEDKRFWSHPGVDILAMGRAMKSNIKARSIVSGGSTLTMQLIRISRKGKDRTVWQKMTEIMLAVRTEVRYSKKDILRLYASHAPFGGNVVGLEAASWRYYGKSPEVLSWSEAACLAVLPNSPALIHPGRGRDLLKLKRDGLLLKMAERGILDSTEAELAMLEPLPDAPHPLPDGAAHFLTYLKTVDAPRIQSTIDRQIQQLAAISLQSHHTILAQNGIQNGAVLVMDTKSGEVLAYIGNVDNPLMLHENAVDMIQAERSSGSILKPLLYAAAFADGQLLPHMLVEDIPTNLRGYQPENFSRSYTGMVPADDALTRSLNVPAVLILRDYGIERFRQDLIQAGLTTIHYSAEHYGLPLILGGAEVSLWDLCGVYASMGRMLSHAYLLNHQYNPDDLHKPICMLPGSQETEQHQKTTKTPILWDYGSLWLTLEAMRNLARPDEEGHWESFQSTKQIAWKTGTSFGFRDAWAIGVTPDFTVGVWIGNADGEGRPGLMGIRAAAPLMFDVFRNLPGNAWWTPPFDALVEVATCRLSGYLAGPDCVEVDSILITPQGIMAGRCPFHTRIYTDISGTFQYRKECAEGERITPQSWFILPPAAAGYYNRNNPSYKSVPPFHPTCSTMESSPMAQLQLIYPATDTRIFVPRELNGEKGHTVFRAAHRSATSPVYWYLDERYLGTTQEFHTMELQPDVGVHRVIIVDHRGERIERMFEVVGE